jgi:carotenoid 1,2-hydratase
VPDGGYAWWYLDALSDDGAHAITVIAFIGSVFSPYYAWARRRGAADPLRHCALNVALYGGRGSRWAMTERGAAAVRRDAGSLRIGPSSLAWDGSGLTVQIDEIAVPLPRRIRGRVRLFPAAVEQRVFALDTAGRHLWRPIAPCARVEVSLDRPRLAWSGAAYLDTNMGDRAPQHDFLHWDWNRASVPGGTAIHYDVTRRDQDRLALAMRYDEGGGVTDLDPPAAQHLPPTRWRIARSVRAEDEAPPAVIATLEDTPFYARSIVAARLLGGPVTAMHESLSLERIRAPWVQAMLPFRMPRAIGAG